jgi:site-specific recombinase XerD
LDWLTTNGYSPRSQKLVIRSLPHADADLRKRGVRKIADLTRPILYDSWRGLIKVVPKHAGIVRSLARYLNAVGTIATGEVEKPLLVSPAAVLSDEYAGYLREVRGCAASTISHHRFASRCFLEHLEVSGVALDSLRPRDIEAYVTQAGKRLCRASLQHEIAAIRGLLRFVSTDGRAPAGLDRQIDTPRLYRLEQLPRALPWETVTALLKSIDRRSAIGLRDYAMFLLIATYGLRASEVVALSLDDIRWRQGSLRIQHPHSMRHSTAVALLKSGVDLSTISHMLGHASPTTTNRYAKVDLEMKRKAIAKVRPVSRKSRTPWARDATILDWLESL